MNDNPFFSIVIPTFNRASLLKKALKSFADQKYENFEVLIIDDGGNDNSAEVVTALNDNRFKYFWKPNAERGAARNYGFENALGTYVNFFDSDDVAYPNHLQTALDTIIKLANPEILHLGYDIKNSEGKKLKVFNNFNGNIIKYGVKQKQISINSLFVNKLATSTVQFSSIRELSASEDALYVCQLAARFSFKFNNEVTTTIINHDSRSMITASELQIWCRKDIMLSMLTDDNFFMQKYARYLDDIKAEFYYMLMLSSFSNKKFKVAKNFFFDYVMLKKNFFLDVRTLVFLNYYLKKYMISIKP